MGDHAGRLSAAYFRSFLLRGSVGGGRRPVAVVGRGSRSTRKRRSRRRRDVGRGMSAPTRARKNARGRHAAAAARRPAGGRGVVHRGPPHALAHDMARAASSSRSTLQNRLSKPMDAFSGEVRRSTGQRVAAELDGRIITGWDVMKIVAQRRVRAHHPEAYTRSQGGGVLPDRYVSVSLGGTVNQMGPRRQLRALLPRGRRRSCAAAMPDGVRCDRNAPAFRGQAVPRRRDVCPHVPAPSTVCGHGWDDKANENPFGLWR